MTTPKAVSPAGVVTVRTLVVFGFSLVSALGVMSTLHARYVIPTIMVDVRDEIDRQVKEHGLRGPHFGAVTEQRFTDSFDMVMKRLDRIEDKIDKQ